MGFTRRSNPANKRFTSELWQIVATTYKAIGKHPFIKGLTDGSLDQAKFRFYVVQDALYLSEFARALSIAAAKAPENEWLVTFNEHSRTAILVERSLHQSFFKDWKMREKEVCSKPMSPTNLGYTNYLISTAYSKPFHELLGALLPCYWIYWEVGKKLERTSSKNDLYRRWIDTYSSEEYAEVCKAALRIVDSVADELTPKQKSETKQHFVTTTRYEYMFWDSAYKLECWPV